MQAERDWWLGKLTEKITDYPRETHCLHITTPEKSVVLGVMQSDLDFLAVLGQVVAGRPLNPHWSEKMVALTQRLADDEVFAEYRSKVG